MSKKLFLSALMVFSLALPFSFVGCSSDEPEAPKPAPVPEKGEYPIPDFRFYDTKEMIVEFEEKQGSKLVKEDPELGYLEFQTNNSEIKKIGYVMSQAIQMFADSSTLVSQKFKDFMKSKGFVADDKIEKGVMKYKSSWSTVNAYAVVGKIDMGDGTILPTGMCFTAIHPVLKEIPYPMLKWDASIDQVKEFEKEKGYDALPEYKFENGNILYTFAKKTEKKEFTELYSHRYLFKDGKMLKATWMVAPEAFILISFNGAGFMTQQSFEDLVKTLGYERLSKEHEVDGKKVSYTLYSNAKEKIKFTLSSWNINLNGHKGHKAAAMDFVPFDGPDYVE